MTRKTGKNPTIPEDELTEEQKRLRERARKLKVDEVAPPTPPPVVAPAAPPAPRVPAVPSWTSVHDLGVVAGALVVLAIAGFTYRALTAPKTAPDALGALAYRVPAGWLERPQLGPQGHPRRAYQAFDDPRLRLEVEERLRPPFPGPLGPVLELDWSRRPGILYKRLERGPLFRHGREWIRTRYAYAYTPTEGDAPALAGAIELAIVHDDHVLVVTLHGPEERLPALEPLLLGAVDLGDGSR